MKTKNKSHRRSGRNYRELPNTRRRHLYSSSELEPLVEKEPIDWEQRRYELAKAAIQGLIGCCNYCKNNDMLWAERGDNLELVIQSISIADEMIKKLKGGQG